MSNMHDLPNVTIVLPAHNEEKYIKECLTSLVNQTYPSDKIEIIVVNNNSIDSTKSIAESFNVQVIDQQEGPVGKVRNKGALEAKGDYLFFLDSDCVAPPDWIKNAVSTLSGNANIVLGGGYLLRDSPFFIEKYWLLETSKSDNLPKDLLGGCIALSKSAFFKVGMFDEKITSGEDTKLAVELRKEGFDVKVCPAMSVIHLGNPITVKHFIKRQEWHSENYLQDLRTSLKDPTFLLIITFIASLVLSVICLFAGSVLAYYGLLIGLFIPVIFSVKRILRTKNCKFFKSIVLIYMLDFLYVVGRAMGVFKSFYRLMA